MDNQSPYADFGRLPGTATRTLLAIACYFFLTSTMQSLVAIRGDTLRLSGLALGLVVAFGSGAVGTLTDIPFGAYADARGVHRVVQAGLLLALGASVILLLPGVPLLFLGALAFGIASSAMGNGLLSWLTLAVPSGDHARVQGLNGSVQRAGALIASAAIGLALAVHEAALLALAGAVVPLLALSLLRPAARVLASIPPRTNTLQVSSLLRGAARAFGLLRSHRIRMAAISSLAINVIFVATNAYLPLTRGPDQATIVALSLVTRDIAAIAVGGIVTLRRLYVARNSLIALSLVVAAGSMWAGGTLLSSHWLIACSGVEGCVVGICIAATNLFTIGGSSLGNRTVGMAVGLLPTRVMLFGLPVLGSIILRSYGLTDVFRLMALILGILGSYAAITARRRPT